MNIGLELNSANRVPLLLELRHISAGYGELQVLFDVNLQISAGEIVSLIGANGAGKTTALRVISGILHPSAGTLLFGAEDTSLVPAHEMVERGMSHVPEGRQMFAHMSVMENLLLGAYARRAYAESRQRIEEQFNLFPRLAERRNQLAGTLSGGEQQMVAIARALMAGPRLLLLDEPSLGLAPKTVDEVFQKIDAIKRSGVTVLIVEQNVVRGLGISNRGYVLQNGSTVLTGTSKELLEDEGVRAAYLGS